MTKHAHEPWCVAPKSKHLIYSNIGDAIAECDGIIDGKSREWDHANAARIVACVNACAGIADPSAIPDLLNASKKAIEILSSDADEFGGTVGDAIHVLCSALAKLKDGA